MLLRSDVFEALRRSAEKLHNLDPSNKDANAAIALSTLRAWISGIETEPQKVQDAAKAVADLQTKDPDNAELPFYLSVATLQMAHSRIPY